MFRDFQVVGPGPAGLPPEGKIFDCSDEYVPDERHDLRPSEIVQSKLIGRLPRGMAIPVSCFHNRRDVRR